MDTKMIGKTGYRCCFGCCRQFLHSEKACERRYLKRKDRARWKTFILIDMEG